MLRRCLDGLQNCIDIGCSINASSALLLTSVARIQKKKSRLVDG